jgi:5'-nucleotidase
MRHGTWNNLELLAHLAKQLSKGSVSCTIVLDVMKILVTNDDGYECEGIKALTLELRRCGHETFTVVPDRNRSGASCSMTIAGRLAVKQLEKNVWLCNGTPVDCVIAVISGGIGFKPDIVVSGINAGANIGTDILYSGTASAARQGALNGIPSIAFSLCDEESERGVGEFFWDEAARWSASNLESLLKIWKRDTFVNVNMPNMKTLPQGFETSFPSRRRYIEKMHTEEAEDGWQRLRLNGFDVETEVKEGSDHYHVLQNKVSVCSVFLHPVSISSISSISESESEVVK